MHIIILITTKDKKEAEKIAGELLNQKLAACTTIIEKIESRFWWQGRIDQAAESLLIVKSRKDLFRRIETTVKSIHSYDVPEIIAIDISAGSAEYLKWIDDNLRR